MFMQVNVLLAAHAVCNLKLHKHSPLLPFAKNEDTSLLFFDGLLLELCAQMQILSNVNERALSILMVHDKYFPRLAVTL